MKTTDIKLCLITKLLNQINKDPNKFYYGVRHSDNDWGKPVTIEPWVVVNRFAILESNISLDLLFIHQDYINLNTKCEALFITTPIWANSMVRNYLNAS
jgi:hypothetical protein